MEGHKVWFKPLNGYSWLGPAAVLSQRGQSSSFILYNPSDISMRGSEQKLHEEEEDQSGAESRSCFSTQI